MSQLVLDEEGMRQVLRGEQGPVAEALRRAAIRVESQAKVNATGHPVEGAQNPEGRGPRVRTDNLRSSITWVLVQDVEGLAALVGTNVVYGRYLEVGWVSSAGNFFKYPFLVPALSAI